MQKINILGIGLTDYSLKESLGIVDRYVKYGGLNTILYVTTPMLILAGKDEEEKNCIEDMDLTLCGDADILRVAKIASAGRIYEVEQRVFLKEFLRRLVRGGEKRCICWMIRKRICSCCEGSLRRTRRGLSWAEAMC